MELLIPENLEQIIEVGLAPRARVQRIDELPQLTDDSVEEFDSASRERFLGRICEQIVNVTVSQVGEQDVVQRTGRFLRDVYEGRRTLESLACASREIAYAAHKHICKNKRRESGEGEKGRGRGEQRLTFRPARWWTAQLW